MPNQSLVGPRPGTLVGVVQRQLRPELDRRDYTIRLTLENDLTGTRWINSVISHQLVDFSIVNVCFHTR